MAEQVGRLHPLVAEATGQVASLQVQIAYWEDLAGPWLAVGDPVPETIAQRLADLRGTLSHRQGMLRRLTQRLVAAATEDAG